MRVLPFQQTREKGKIYHRDTFCVRIWGTVGRGTGCGRLRCGAASVGDTRRIAGTYQRRKLSTDNTRYNPETNPRYPNIAMRTYRPKYTNTEIQDENRTKFAEAVAYWQSLTDAEKAIYDERGAKVNLSGYNVAIQHFIRTYDQAT